MSGYDRSDILRVAGTLRLSVRHLDAVADDAGGFRRRYGYIIESTDSGATHEGDLHSGTGGTVDAEAALRTLVSFLSAAGDAYQYAMVHPDSESENLDLFPTWVAEAAYLNADELAMLLLEDDAFAEPTSDVDAVPRFISVVFQRGDDAGKTLAILD